MAFVIVYNQTTNRRTDIYTFYNPLQVEFIDICLIFGCIKRIIYPPQWIFLYICLYCLKGFIITYNMIVKTGLPPKIGVFFSCFDGYNTFVLVNELHSMCQISISYHCFHHQAYSIYYG